MTKRRPLESLMKEHYVYQFYSRKGTLLYVGMTNCTFLRFQQHAASASWWWRVVEVEIDTVPDRYSARALERHYIKTLMPKHNRQPIRRSYQAIMEEEMQTLRRQRDASLQIPTTFNFVTVGELLAEADEDDEED